MAKNVIVLVCGFSLLFLATSAFGANDSQCTVWVATVQDTVNPMVAEYISEVISKAEKASVAAIIIELDTPGGLVESTRQIVKKIMNARIPIITYVSPHGARAASAGMFISIASHVIAMAPATNIGAAHPVSMGPMGPMEQDQREQAPGSDQNSENRLLEIDNRNVMEDKVMNDLLAWARTIAESKGRNIDWVEQSIRKSISSTEREALESGVIDLVCENRSNLLEKLNGFRIKVADQEIVLDLTECVVVEKPMTRRQKFLSILINPTLAIYLLALGGLGLYFELSHPGFIIPGVVGGISLILGLFAMHTLPINIAGLLLILLSFAFFGLEVKMPSYGVLTIGGIASFVLGSAMLVDSDVSGMKVSLQAIIPLAFAVAVITLFLIALIVSTHRESVSTGQSAMIGKKGLVTRRLAPEGQIFLHGEIWRARSIDGNHIEENMEVVVTNMIGLTLLVKLVELAKKEG